MGFLDFKKLNCTQREDSSLMSPENST